MAIPAPDPIRCPICRDSETSDPYPNARGPARRWPLARCGSCGLVFQRRAPTDAELEEGYRTAYGEPQRRFGGPLERLIELFRRARLRLAKRLLPPGGSVLDVGCGRGLFLRLLRAHGYQVRGTEYSAATARNADPGIAIDVGDVTPGRYPDASFDLISIWHVLEHLRHPDVTLAACALALKPGGALLLAVPNHGSAQARFGGEHWFHLDLPRHVFHFDAASLSRLLRSHGFEIERCRTGQFEMDPFGWVQTALNRLGFRHNALYDSLRNNAEVKRDLSFLQRALMLALLPLGMALAVPLSFAERPFGQAGTLILVARKPRAALQGRAA